MRSFLPEPRLELHLEGQLNRSGPAELIERTEAPASIIAGIQRLAKSLRGPTKPSVAESTSRRAEVGVIEHVEQLCPKLQLHLSVDWEVSMQRKIPLPCPKTTQSVSAEVPLSGRFARSRVDRRRGERGRIEAPATRARGKQNRRALRFGEVKRLSRNDIRTNGDL